MQGKRTFNPRSIGGCGRANPSVCITAKHFFSPFSPPLASSSSHPRSTTFASNSHGFAPITALISTLKLSKLVAIGPHTLSICSAPAKMLLAPPYGSLRDVGRRE